MQAVQGSNPWVRRVEHVALRVVSLAFSLVSAHAIRWFFSPLDGVDTLMPIITWVAAVGFGILGYFVSRGIAHRITQKESFLAYVPIVFVVEFVEMFCNYALAAAMIQRAAWLQAVPESQRGILTILTYGALSIIPLVGILLAVVDVDLDRGKGGRHRTSPGTSWTGQKPQPKSSPSSSYGTGYQPAPMASYPTASPPKGTQNGASPLGVGP